MPVSRRVYSFASILLLLLGLVWIFFSRTSPHTASAQELPAAQFVGQHQLTFPIQLDEDGSVGKSFRIQALPSSYFIGPDGIIQDVIIGGPITEAVFQAQAETLLKGVH